ncbi:hypothetical protein EVJ58_g1431 [Rhodofomes roseus]|uniref:Uncharacterized protein n=1 Tax=Rhodofomes roseus TaxID=34475 RepID=A0A4Y9Z1I5_9APHY|nr:hypothetical protein EVJ58_g1431 [Rhodofomes roseus]
MIRNAFHLSSSYGEPRRNACKRFTFSAHVELWSWVDLNDFPEEEVMGILSRWPALPSKFIPHNSSSFSALLATLQSVDIEAAIVFAIRGWRGTHAVDRDDKAYFVLRSPPDWEVSLRAPQASYGCAESLPDVLLDAAMLLTPVPLVHLSGVRANMLRTKSRCGPVHCRATRCSHLALFEGEGELVGAAKALGGWYQEDHEAVLCWHFKSLGLEG